jgi:hypothetical protein
MDIRLRALCWIPVFDFENHTLQFYSYNNNYYYYINNNYNNSIIALRSWTFCTWTSTMKVLIIVIVNFPEPYAE